MKIWQKRIPNMLKVAFTSLLLILFCIFLSAAITYGAPLNWCKSQSQALSIAQKEGKIILLIAGRNTCGNSRYMREICESNISLRRLIEQNFVPWYCDTDSNEWYKYAQGLSDSIYLPLICCIKPSATVLLFDRSTGTQTPVNFLFRLQHIIDTQKINIRKK
jgi:thioredoxin-related protein